MEGAPFHEEFVSDFAKNRLTENGSLVQEEKINISKINFTVNMCIGTNSS